MSPPREGCRGAAVRTLLVTSLMEFGSPPSLFVGGADVGVIELNEEALARLQGLKALEIIPGASHLFPEPGALEAVVDHAARWFERYLAAGSETSALGIETETGRKGP